MPESISYIYRIIDKYTPALRKISSATKSFGDTVKKSQAGLKKLSTKLTSVQSIATSAATTIGGKIALDKYASFATSMNKLESVTFATEDQMARMRDMAKDLGATTQFTAGEAAQGMTYLAMAGLDTEQVLKAIPGALQLAAAGGIELGQAADIATNVLGQMGLQVEDLSRVNNVLAAAQSKANFNITELFEAMRPVGTTASNLGMSLEELSAHLGVMANAGEKGSIAGTLLRNALTEIAGATKSQVNLYKDLGINLGDFVNEAGKITNFKGLIAELQKLQEQGRLTVPILQDLYGDRGFRAMQILAGAGAESIDKLQQSITGTNAAVDAANIQMKGLPGILKAMSSAFEAVNIAIFESGLDQVLIDIGTRITLITRSLASANPALLKVSGIIALIATVAGPLIVALGVISAAIGAISLPMIAVAAGIAAVVGGLFLLYKGIKFVMDNWRSMVEAFYSAIEWFKTEFPLLTDIIKLAFDLTPIGVFVNSIGHLRDVFSAFMTDIDAGFTAIKEKFTAIKELPGEIGGKIKSVGTGLSDKVKGLFGFGKEKGVAAQNASVAKSQLNGQIVVAPAKGAQVDSAKVSTDVPGNLGFNIAAGAM